MADLDPPPDQLHVCGELPRGPRVAIVGTRHPTPRARRFTWKLAAELARAGVAVVSGGAKGIDTAAHEGALDVGGVTVVVAPASFNRPYPPENRPLFERVVESGGAYVTRVPEDTPAGYASFFVRNALLAALTHVLVVAEAGVRSGARNAASHARRLGRPVFAVPAPPWNSRGRGCILELGLGAQPLMASKDVLRVLARARLHAVPIGGPTAATLSAPQPVACSGSAAEIFSGAFAPGCPSARPAAQRGSAPAQQTLGFPQASEPEAAISRVLASVRAGAVFADDVCAETGLSAARVQEVLLTLTLKGVLVADSAGRIRLLSLQDY